MLRNLSSCRNLCLCLLGVFLLIGALGVTGAHAQLGSNGAILGTVTDSSGAAIAGAMVTVKNSATGVTYSTVTDAQGRYNVQDLIIGTYEVDVEAAGFQKYAHAGITLTVGSQIVVDAPMQVGTVQQTVTVESDVSHVETTSTAVTNLVEEKQLNDLPLNGRNYYALISLAPGVLQIAGGGGTFYGTQNNFAVAGGRPSGQAYLVDDTNTGDFWNHSTGSGALGTQLGVDSIAEFQTMLNTYGAQFGGSGAAFNASTKSGTNQFHGTAYEYFLNSATSAANNFVATSAPLTKAFDNRNQFGFSLGGPVKKDRAFFFVNYEGLRESAKSFSQLTEPDLEARGCQTIGLTACQALGGVDQAVNPQFQNKNGTFTTVPWVPCGGGSTPANQYPLGNPCAAAENIASMLSVYPIANLSDNLATGTALTGNIATPTYSRENYAVARFDYTVSDKDTLFAKLTSDTARRLVPGAIPLIPETDNTADTYVTLEERRIFSPTLLNVLHLSYVRPNENAAQTTFPVVNVPIGAISQAPYANCNGCITNSPFDYFNPQPLIQGRQGYNVLGTNAGGISVTGTLPYYLIPNNFTIGDDVIWTKGAHSFKIGFSVERMVENTWAPFTTAGSWTPSGTAVTPLAAIDAGQFSAAGPGELPESILANAGLPPQDGTLDVRETLFAPYFEDDWKVSSRVTLNLGLRYDPTRNALFVRHLNENLLNAPWSGGASGSLTTSADSPSSANSPFVTNSSALYPAGTNCAVPGANGGLPLVCGFVPVRHPYQDNVSLKNWDPRIGIAWDPFKDHKTSVRAGVGMFHTVIVARDYDMWIQPPAVPGNETIAPSVAPGSPQTFPFEFTSTNPCAFASQPTVNSVTVSGQVFNITPAVSGQGFATPVNPNAGQYANCLTVGQGGATYYGATKTPYTIQYNVNVQREVMPQTIVSIGYVGSHGVDLVMQHDFNAFLPCGNGGQPDPATGSPVYVQGFSAALNNAWEPCPRSNPGIAATTLLNPQAYSTYNSLQVSVNRRFSKGIQFQGSYTYSKSIDLVDGSYGLDGNGTVADPWNFGTNRGVQSNSRSGNLNVSTVYTLPFHKNQLVDGWQVTGIYTWLSGAPFTVTGATRGVGYGQTINWAPNNPGCNGNPYTGVSPDAAANKYITGTNNAGQFPIGPTTASIIGGGTTPFLNPNCFSPTPAGEVGNLGKNTFYGPSDWNLDMSLLKDTKITKISERFDIQFRAEFFNILNHPYWTTPTVSAFSACASANCGTPGGITTTGAALLSNNVTNTFGTFGNPNSTPRRMQFGLRVTF